MPKLDHKNRAKRSTEDLDRAEAQEALQRWADENLDPEQVDQLGDLVAAAYGGYDDDDDNEDGAMTDAYMRRRKGGRDSEKFNLSDRDEDETPGERAPSWRCGRHATAVSWTTDAWRTPRWRERPRLGGRSDHCAPRSRSRGILARINPNVLRIRTRFYALCQLDKAPRSTNSLTSPVR